MKVTFLVFFNINNYNYFWHMMFIDLSTLCVTAFLALVKCIINTHCFVELLTRLFFYCLHLSHQLMNDSFHFSQSFVFYSRFAFVGHLR